MALDKFDLGIAGLGMANSCCMAVMYFALLNYSNRVEKLRGVVPWPSTKTFEDLGEFLYMGIPSALMIGLEWWAFEVMTIMSGWIGVSEQAANIVLMNIAAFLFCLPMGMNSATCTTMGQEIGREDISTAKQYYYITATISATLIVFVLVNFLYFHVTVFSWFTSIESVQESIIEVLPFYMCAILPDCWQGYM